jgi:C1A family cysteine protease
MMSGNQLLLGLTGLLLMGTGCQSVGMVSPAAAPTVGMMAVAAPMEHGYGAVITDDTAKLVFDDGDGFRTKAEASKPSSVDLRPNCPPIRHQMMANACTGFAAAGFLEYLVQKESGRYVPLSPRFVWYLARQEYERAVPQTNARKRNAFARTADGLNAITQVGAPEESAFAMATAAQMSEWFYLPPVARATALDDFAAKAPSPDAFADAKRYRLTKGYRTLHTFSQMKRALEWGSPVVLTMACYESLDRDEVVRTGRMPVPDPKKEKYTGGHAVCAVGYDDQQRVVIIRNSWGTKSGDKGYYYMPYDFIKQGFLYDGFAAK